MGKHKIRFVEPIELCEGCDDTKCQECCTHDEFDHDVCLYCSYERNAGDKIDWTVSSIALFND